MLEALRKVLSTNRVVLPQHAGLTQSMREGGGAVLGQADPRMSELLSLCLGRTVAAFGIQLLCHRTGLFSMLYFR